MSRAAASVSVGFLAQVAGTVIPALVMLVSLPIVQAHLSVRSFATFAFLFTTVSLMGVLDAGLSRSVTYFASRHLQEGRSRDAMNSLWAALTSGVVLSVVGCVLFLLARKVAIGSNAARGVDLDAIGALLWFFPAFVCGSLLRGFLEAEQRFVALNSIQLVVGLGNAIAPLVLVNFTSDVRLFAVVFGLNRVVFVVSLLLLLRVTQREFLMPDRGAIAKLPEVFRYSRWLFASNLMGVAIVYADRVAVATSFPPQLIAAYVVPMELMLRGSILIGALSTVLFPIFVRAATRRSNELIQMVMSAQLFAFGIVLLLGVCTAELIPVVLNKWMGQGFGVDATLTARVALIALAPIGCTVLAMAVLNAQGKTADPATLHSVELPLYAVALLLVVPSSQLALVVVAWYARICFDMVGMQYILLKGRSGLWLAQQGGLLLILLIYLLAAWADFYSQTFPLIAFGIVSIGMIFFGGRQFVVRARFSYREN